MSEEPASPRRARALVPQIPGFNGLRRKMRRWIHSDADQAWHDLLEHNSHGEDVITEEERTLISAALQLDETTADEISIARSEIMTLDRDADYESTLNRFRETRKSRLPVAGENLDDILGYVALKDVVMYVGEPADFDLQTMMRPIPFVPESMTLDRVLKRFRKDRAQLAVVVDEYGGTAGLVTVQDIMAELVGDIEDEDTSDAEPLPPKRLTDKTYAIDSRMEMEAFRSFFNMSVPEDEEQAETVGGYLFAYVGRIPAAGEEITAEDLLFKVTKADGRRILEMEVSPAP